MTNTRVKNAHSAPFALQILFEVCKNELPKLWLTALPQRESQHADFSSNGATEVDVKFRAVYVSPLCGPPAETESILLFLIC